jgi:hypothetical protein
MYDTASLPSRPPIEATTFVQQAQDVFQALMKVPMEPARRKRGRPQRLTSWNLWLGLLVGLLRGLHCQRDLWRLLTWQGFGSFAPVTLCDQAIYKRLASEGVHVFEQIWLEVRRLLAERLAPYAQSTLAPFASLVVAIDDTTLDAMARHVQSLRGLPKGASGLLPGKIAAVFDLRLQQWRDFLFIADPQENEKAHVRQLLHTLPKGTLIVHDRGYFSFPWFALVDHPGLVVAFSSACQCTLEHIAHLLPAGIHL